MHTEILSVFLQLLTSINFAAERKVDAGLTSFVAVPANRTTSAKLRMKMFRF